MKKISRVSGQSGRISGVYIQVEDKFNSMLEYARLRKSQNSFSDSKAYDLLRNSCIHFVKDVAARAGVENPWLTDPRPNSSIGEFRGDFLDLDYSNVSNKLVIETLGTY
ncbi:hypothetical protein [Thalassomonas haliotis]|uniref:hypothetical protein n=1 Tax=Thalassomonas haliotis TaxID=485448 RepID=UPI00235F2E87|nr:hypothetical protein [Thalassomonas haliotis]